MTVNDIFSNLSKFNYSSLHDMFDACNDYSYVFPLIKLLDIDWRSVEKNLNYSAKYLKIDKNRFFVCCKDNHPFLLLHHNQIDDTFDVHCTDVILFEDYFMPDIFKYAIRWNKCEYNSSLQSEIKFSDSLINK